MEAFVRARGIRVPARALRWSGAELFDLVRREAVHLEAELLAIPVAHERRAMTEATLVPFAREAVAAMRISASPPPSGPTTTGWSPTSSSRASNCCRTSI